jgi:hypothetical protein
MKRMEIGGERGRRSRLSPAPFLAGVAVAFTACCAAGRLAPNQIGFDGFVRFHRYISPQTQFFATPSEVRALGRASLPPDRIAVVVGGNSILHGFGQAPEEVWTKHLQQELGDRYRVINLALLGARPYEFGGVGAEILERDHPRLLFVTDCGSAGLGGDPDGAIYRYFFWEAYYKGWVPPDPRRDARLGEVVAERKRKKDAAFAEMTSGAWLDARLRFQDLWTSVAYHGVSTVWAPDLSPTINRPRKRYADPDGAVGHPTGQVAVVLDAQNTDIVRSFLAAASYAEGPVDDCYLARCIRDCFPEAARRRSLMLVVRDSPRYVGRLSPVEQTAYAAIFPAWVRVLEANGMAALDIAGDYSEQDFADRCHLSEQGGRRLAQDVAPRVRQLAHQLGYLSEGGR